VKRLRTLWSFLLLAELSRLLDVFQLLTCVLKWRHVLETLLFFLNKVLWIDIIDIYVCFLFSSILSLVFSMFCVSLHHWHFHVPTFHNSWISSCISKNAAQYEGLKRGYQTACSLLFQVFYFVLYLYLCLCFGFYCILVFVLFGHYFIKP